MSQSSSHELDNQFTVLKWPQESPDLNPVANLQSLVQTHTMVVHITDLQQIHKTVKSVWTKIQGMFLAPC